MKHAVEMGSGAMVYIPSFIKTGSGVDAVRVGGFTGGERGDRITLILFF
jgi:hypothetical protein